MGAPTPADGTSNSHSRHSSHDNRPSLNIQQPNPEPHVTLKPPPKSVLKKRSADEHTALLASQRDAAASQPGEEGDYFGDIDDEDDWGETKSTGYLILLTLAIGG